MTARFRLFKEECIPSNLECITLGESATVSTGITIGRDTKIVSVSFLF